MLIALHWSEWLRRVEVDCFEAASAVMVEDYCQNNLAAERAAFVFDDTDRPMVQCLESMWQGRFSVKQLVEIYNALTEDESRRVRAFKNRDQGLQQIAFKLVQMGKDATPRRITQEDIHMETVVTEQTGTTDAAADAAATDAQKAAESPVELKRQAAAQKAEEKAAAKKAAEEKKVADKKAKDEAAAAKKLADAANKPIGVIGTLINMLTEVDAKKQPVKRSVDELFAVLLDKFPDRGEGMKTTVRVQLVRLGKEGRLIVHSEDRKDSEGKKLAGKAYWGEHLPEKAK